MLPTPLLIPPSADFWPVLARTLLRQWRESGSDSDAGDFSSVRVLVPNFVHAQLLKNALANELKRTFIPPRITTLQAWLKMLPPDPTEHVVSSSTERMMALYAELRQHGWLKKLFAARRNVDLLPLAQTLMTLFDELSEALLPAMHLEPEAAEDKWQAALEHLPLPVRTILSDESQLVWSLWKSQLGSSDPTAACLVRMMRLAAEADAPLVWISHAPADALHEAFLNAYAEYQPVLRVMPDWHKHSVAAAYAAAWPELPEQARHENGSLFDTDVADIAAPSGVSLQACGSLEDEAQRAANTIINWLQAGKTCVAIIAQDRVVARRMRALLERAAIYVSDETGWKLSTTRAAASIAALLDVVSTRAETIALLDLLKSPCVFADMPDKADRVMEIEHALRRFNILGGWDAVLGVLDDSPAARQLVEVIFEQARTFAGRKTLSEWGAVTDDALRALGMRDALQNDGAGIQVVKLLDMLIHDCGGMLHAFSFAEWRAFLSLQLESTPFVPEVFDRRVVMLQLNGAQLRRFDAVIMVGADADHLPSQLNDVLFFANAVRRELGLATREMRQRMQLRDFAELLSVNPEVVLSYQSYRNGEPNAVSSWIERLQLTLERAGAGMLPVHRADMALRSLTTALPHMPSPAAPHLLPRKLSASAYNSLVACPYQFFATRMLGLAGLDELSDMPEKRDYGDWLHAILKTYHESIRDHKVAPAAREGLLREISQKVFDEALARSAAALGYYARWQKVIPAYLDWANEREEKGWRFAFGEQPFEKTLNWDGGQITLRGCIDRIDEHEDGSRAILDYKTRSLQALRDKVKEAEDHQLAFYGVLSDLPVSAGHFVALEVTKDKTGDAEAKNFIEWQAMLEQQIVKNVRAIASGAPLKASGIERVCVYCEVRGLCRKGAW
ncbi:PD-(D/E)XK nuclease family protein [Noviherbaspirillum saxi]|uniref:PD-(D/E)XK nuclease family protein n=1 Tax=Noviherbaspirillum saxi TaxID=2320863 RepID=A0A3A3GAR2_9BURK|nr:PD-(D/E)XK nuclease family protein [Noviherbaspirillum saxi]RJF97969.1 PD-(D/E)XK nuclease family protein [Noviherbaspirillum saxi]